MATGMQTEEYLSVNDLPHLLNEICPISPHHVLSFGLQLQVEYTKIQEFEMHYKNKVAILGGILYKALNRHPPLTKGEIVKALRSPSVQEDRLANQIETNYIPLSQRCPQHVGAESLPLAYSHQIPLESAPPHATLDNMPQTLTPPQPNTSRSFASQHLTTEVPRPDQPQPNLDQVDQSHQLPASLSMLPQPAPRTSQSVSLQPQPSPSLPSLWTPELQHLFQLLSTYQPPPSSPRYVTPGNLPQTFNKLQPPPSPNTSHLFDSQQLSTDLPKADQPQPNLDLVGQSHCQSTSHGPQPTPQTSQTVFLQPQPGPSLISLQGTPKMPTVPQLTTSAPPQTILPSLTQPSPWAENSQLAASQQLTTELLRPDQAQPNLDGHSHQQHTGSLHPQPGSSLTSSQRGPQLQGRPQFFPPNHSSYPPPSVVNHRPPESQFFPTHDQQSSHNCYSSFQPSHHQHFSITQPQHNQYCSFTQPSNNQYTFTQSSHDQNYFQPSRHTPYRQAQCLQSYQFQWQSSSQPPSQHHCSPLFSSQHFHTSDTNLPQTQESQSSPAPTCAATSESSPSPRQQPSSSPTQQFSFLPKPQQIPVSNAGSPVSDTGRPSAKRLRPYPYRSPPCHSAPASEANMAFHLSLVDKFIKFVKLKYSARVVLKDKKWSLSPTVKFINLACIDRKCVKSKEFENVTKAMVMDGNVDVIQKKKGQIELCEIAKGISLPSCGSEQENDRRLILVEGAPGVGKSTFAWEFCRRWTDGEIAQQYDLVFLLRLRDERIREAQNLQDLFFHSSMPNESLTVYDELRSSQTFHTLIILEGYDELPDSCRNNPLSVFNQLISGESLPLATVLVTSRPWATKDLNEKHACDIYQHIEVLGFTKQQIKEYINESIENQEMRSDFYSYLEKHPQINSGMYIPLNSAIVVAVYKEGIQEDRQPLPSTITELYSCCIEILIRRHLKHNAVLQIGNEIQNISVIDLPVPSDVHKNFVHMCHLAYTGIVEATEVKLIFGEYELPEHFDNLGFMDSVTDLYVTGETVSSHNFLHLTFQEFFAAVHISTLSREQQLQYFMEGKSDSGSKKGRLNVVLKFLAGLRKLDCITDDSVSHIVDTPSSVSSYLTPQEVRVGVALINWLFEAQSEAAISLILGERKIEFKASKSQMSPMDYFSLGYCISHSQCQWVLLLTGRIEISKEKINLLADGATDVTGEGKVVELGDDALSHLKAEKLDLLFTELNNILCLQKLSIKDLPTQWPPKSEQSVQNLLNKGDNSIEFFITFIKKSCSLQHILIHSVIASAHVLLELLQTIHHHPTLQEKSVKELGCSVTTAVDVNALSQLCSKYYHSMRTNFIRHVGGLSDDGVVVLAEFLQHKYRSRELSITNGGTSDDGTVSLAEAFHHNSTIHTLKLWGNRITSKGAVALTDALRHNSTLQSLDLSMNNIGDKGAVALDDSLSTLESLDLDDNSIGNEGTGALADVLYQNSTLQSLDLSMNNIDDDEAVALADALHHNSTLQSLNLSGNNITDEGALALAEALLENQSLQELYLDDNDSICDRATCKFVEALTQNSSLNEVTLPAKCEEYATKCPNYHQVQTKLTFGPHEM